MGEKSVCTSIIVASEMRYGARKRGCARLLHNVDVILSAMQVLPFEAPADEFYARIRDDVERAGTPVGSTIWKSRTGLGDAGKQSYARRRRNSTNPLAGAPPVTSTSLAGPSN